MRKKPVGWIDPHGIERYIAHMAETFRSRVREEREARGWSRSTLSNLSNMGETTLKYLEIKPRMVQIDNLVRIAVGLNLSTDYLLGLSEERRPIDSQHEHQGGEDDRPSDAEEPLPGTLAVPSDSTEG